jgi:hypothetical protein
MAADRGEDDRSATRDPALAGRCAHPRLGRRPSVHQGSGHPIHSKNKKTAPRRCLRSPLPDSNRRTLPYHGGPPWRGNLSRRIKPLQSGPIGPAWHTAATGTLRHLRYSLSTRPQTRSPRTGSNRQRTVAAHRRHLRRQPAGTFARPSLEPGTGHDSTHPGGTTDGASCGVDGLAKLDPPCDRTTPA